MSLEDSKAGQYLEAHPLVAVGGVIIIGGLIYLWYRSSGTTSSGATKTVAGGGPTNVTVSLPGVSKHHHKNHQGHTGTKNITGSDLARAATDEKLGKKNAADVWIHRAWISAGRPHGVRIFQDPYPHHDHSHALPHTVQRPAGSHADILQGGTSGARSAINSGGTILVRQEAGYPRGRK